MNHITLSDAFVGRYRGTPGKRVSILDSRIPGLQVEVSARHKRFVLRSRGHYVTLGRWPVMTVTEARVKALDLLRGLEASLCLTASASPKAPQVAEQSKLRPPLRAVLEDYIRDKALGARTEEDYRGLLKRYWADYLDRPVTNLGPDEFLSRYREIKSPSQANHSTRIVRALYRYFNAANDDALPIPTVKALAIDGAHRLDPRQRMVARDEQAKWIGAVDAKAGPTARDLFRLLALTGLRQGEGLALTWDNIDLDRRVLTVPITKNGKPHSLPIGIRLAKLLDARRALSGEKVFSISVRNTRFSVARVVEASGVAWSCHDLRRGFATAATRLGIPDRAVKRLMNHSENDVTGKHYIWLDVEDVRPHIEAIEDHFWSMWSAPAVSEASAENGPAESPRLTARGAPVT